MTPAILTTTNICRYLQQGDITFIPDDHIKKILRKFFDKLQKGLSVEDTKQKRIECIKKYINNHALMAERYIKIMDKQNETSRNRYRKNSKQNQEHSLVFENMFTLLKAFEITRPNLY